MIESARLVIREYEAADLDALFAVQSDPATMAMWPSPFTRAQSERWLHNAMEDYRRDGFGRWAVLLKPSGELIGDCGIVRRAMMERPVVDLGYIFHRDYWGKGYAYEAACAVRDYAFGVLQLDVLSANMAHDHHRSRRVAEKIGMVRVGEFHHSANRGFLHYLYEIRRPH